MCEPREVLSAIEMVNASLHVTFISSDELVEDIPGVIVPGVDPRATEVG